MSGVNSAMVGRGDALVLFGATGDLAKKMLYPALYQLAQAGSLPATVVGVALSDWRTDELVEHVRTSVAEHSSQLDADAFARLADALTRRTLSSQATAAGTAPRSR